jgi:5'-3' exonuclease
MGIPSYFSYIIKNYRAIISNLSKDVPYHHLYMDCNSVIYDAWYSIQKSHNNTGRSSSSEIELKIHKQVINKITEYVNLIKPSKTVFIAFDGVAPFAKMSQQRTRRYKSAYTANLYPLNATTETETETDTDLLQWNTSQITPGTEFMNSLMQSIQSHFANNPLNFTVEHFVISTTHECGEGEHKLVEHMKTVTSPCENAIIYGLDSDLIMLAIFNKTLFENIYIFRESPEFLKSIQEWTVVDETRVIVPMVMNIELLTKYILVEMDCDETNIQCVYDYIFLCFFLGNDFLPHFPALNIRTHGIQVLMDIYKKDFGSRNKYLISKEKTIIWKNVYAFIRFLAEKEDALLKKELLARDTQWDKKRNYGNVDIEQQLQNIPVTYRAEEKYINPAENGWTDRYYKSLFCEHGQGGLVVDRKAVCINYLEGLEWTFKYYSDKCPDWRWKYNYHYPPLLRDLSAFFPQKTTSFITQYREPFSPWIQLSYVLSKSQMDYLPSNIRTFLLDNYRELYPEMEDVRFQWAFCRYFWESHVRLPEIELELLEKWEKMELFTVTKDVSVG